MSYLEYDMYGNARESQMFQRTELERLYEERVKLKHHIRWLEDDVESLTKRNSKLSKDYEQLKLEHEELKKRVPQVD